MTYEQARQLVIALIASGRLPISSFNVHNQKGWANEVREEVEKYIDLFVNSQTTEK